MKRNMVLVISVLVLSVMPSLAQDTSLSTSAGWASKVPVVDGVLSTDEWKDATILWFDGSDKARPGVVGPDSGTVGGPNKDGVQTAADSSATVYIMNDAKFLYIAVDAVDDILDFSKADVWRNDSVEIRVDGNMSRKTAKEDTIMGFSPVIRGDGKAVSFNADLTKLAKSAGAVKADGKGWIVEFMCPIDGFKPVVGFDIAIDDGDNPAVQDRDSQYRWTGLLDAGWTDETQWGYLTLATAPNPGPVQKATSGLAKTVPTMDGVLAKNEWKDATVLYINATDAIRPGVVGPDSGTVGGPGKKGFQSETDSSAWIYVMNDSINLYVAIDAVDDILDFSKADVWRNDSVEIRVDGNMSKKTEKEDTIMGFSPVIRGDGKAVSFNADLTKLAKSAGAAKADGKGWVVEFQCPVAGFKPVVGFDISINDADDPAVQDRNSQYRWNGLVDGGWSDETQWGELTLAGISSSVEKAMWELF